MDLLTHLFLPLTILYAIRPRIVTPAVAALVAGFAIVPDADKFVGVPGAMHSLVPLVPMAGGLLAIEWWTDGRLQLSPLLVAALASHLFLDVIDGGPVPLLFPLIETGVGLEYPARTVFGSGPLGVTVDGPLVALRTTVPRTGFLGAPGTTNAYGLLQGYGIASLVAFGSVVLGRRRWGRIDPQSTEGHRQRRPDSDAEGRSPK